MKTRCPDRGQSAVELALALPFVLILILVVVQVTVVGRDQVLVVHAAREAARAAAVGDDPVAAAIRGSGLGGGRLEVRVTTGGSAGEPVTARVTYRAPTDVPLVGPLVGDVTLTASVTMRHE